MAVRYATTLTYTLNGVERTYSLLTDVSPVLTLDQFRRLSAEEVEARAATLEKWIGVCGAYERENEPVEVPVLTYQHDSPLPVRLTVGGRVRDFDYPELPGAFTVPARTGETVVVESQYSEDTLVQIVALGLRLVSAGPDRREYVVTDPDPVLRTTMEDA